MCIYRERVLPAGRESAFEQRTPLVVNGHASDRAEHRRSPLPDANNSNDNDALTRNAINIQYYHLCLSSINITFSAQTIIFEILRANAMTSPSRTVAAQDERSRRGRMTDYGENSVAGRVVVGNATCRPDGKTVVYRAAASPVSRLYATASDGKKEELVVRCAFLRNP